MRELRNIRSGMLGTLLWETRFIYSLFLVFCLASYVVMGVLIVTRTHFAPEELVHYYVGNEEKDLYGKTFNELLELTHFHLFSVPVLLFIQGHLFLMTYWPRRLKIIIVLASFIGAGLMIGGPWLIVYVSPKCAVLMMIGRIFLMLSFLFYFCVPMYEMWLRKIPTKNSLASSVPKEEG